MTLVSTDTTVILELSIDNELSDLSDKEPQCVAELLDSAVRVYLQGLNKNNLFKGEYSLDVSIYDSKVNLEISVFKEFSLVQLLKNVFYIPTDKLQAFRKINVNEIGGALSITLNTYLKSSLRERIAKGEEAPSGKDILLKIFNVK